MYSVIYMDCMYILGNRAGEGIARRYRVYFESSFFDNGCKKTPFCILSCFFRIMSLARNNLSAASAARIVISQDTFDEAVKDNIETFGMDREEAIKDAIEQFQNAGADLSAVLLDGSDPNDHPVIASLNAINSWLEKGGEFSLSNIPDWEPWKEAFRDFIRNVGKSGDDGTSNRHVALSKNAVSVLWKCTELLCGLAKLEALTEEQTINPCPFQKSLVPVLRLSFEAMRALCTNFDEARAQLPAYYINYVHQVLQTAGTFRPFTRFSYPAEDDSFSTFLYALQKSSIQLATTLCVRREGNKTALFDAGAVNVLTSVLLGIVSEELQDIPCTKESIENHIANFVGVISDLFVRMLTDDDMDVHVSISLVNFSLCAFSCVFAYDIPCVSLRRLLFLLSRHLVHMIWHVRLLSIHCPGDKEER